MTVKDLHFVSPFGTFKPRKLVIKANGFIVLSKYPIKCLELVFVLTNFEISVLSTLTF